MSDNLISEMSRCIRDLMHAKCFQATDAWTEQYCIDEECEFLVNGDECEVQERAYELIERAEPREVPF